MQLLKLKQPHTEIAIVGGGLAGRLLAYRYIKETNHSVVLFDKACHRSNHMFGFFDDGRESLELPRSMATHSFAKWQIQSRNNIVTHDSNTVRYRLIKAEMYENYLFQSICDNGRFTLVKDSVESVRQHMNASEIYCSTATYSASECFDTRPNITAKHHLKQHFLGQYINTKQPVFTSNNIQLMNFDVDQSHGMHFMYLLPLSKSEALIESTVYSAAVHETSWYETQIKHFIQQKLSLTDYEVTDTEKGVIPLNFSVPLRSFGKPVGLRHGALRTSSGYAFSQIHDQINSININSPDSVKQSHSSFERWMDDVLLRVILNYPDMAPYLFTKMADLLDGDEFASFMLGKSPLKSKLKLMLGLPKKPFLHQAIWGKSVTQ